MHTRFSPYHFLVLFQFFCLFNAEGQINTQEPIIDKHGVITLTLSSPHVGGKTKIQIIKPELASNRILYLLPVTPWPGYEEKWKKLGSGVDEIIKHDYHNTYGYTVVIPHFPNHMPWFVDHVSDPERQHETYMMETLLPFIDKYLGKEKPTRHLVGFSKSGYGSLSLLFRHPDTFHAASVWDPGGIHKAYEPDNNNSLSDAAGSQELFNRYQLTVPLAANRHHFQDSTRIAISGYSNDKFLERLRYLRGYLEQEEIQFLYEEDIHVPHRWYAGWLEYALDSLQKMNTSKPRLDE